MFIRPARATFPAVTLSLTTVATELVLRAGYGLLHCTTSIPGGGGGGTPLYGLYRYVRPQKGMVFQPFWS